MQNRADDMDLPKLKSRQMSEPETGSNLLSEVSEAVSSDCPSPGKNKRFGARSDLKEEVSWRTSSPTATKSGLVTKRSTRNPRTPMMSMSKKTLTKEDYKQLIEMHSRTLKETSSAPTLSFVDLTEDDAPSFKRIMTPTPAQRVPSSSQEEAFLTQEKLFYEIQDRETGEEVARLEKAIENIRLKRAAKLASREKTEAPLIDAICAKYSFTKAPAPKIPELDELLPKTRTYFGSEKSRLPGTSLIVSTSCPIAILVIGRQKTKILSSQKVFQ
ncbi:Oidioi.mRNA.OKI2018_I69.XSR.g13749.t1.cds [Oikopleura dioica]|uniref:Oidioi.mRNA.OKI2018_I69.XSR.g13749.t1.cds n=1 Tax=Oikopleura dioica TaxID=34765 RepID=A0ABN7SCI5_OIKDI|nr:Oidioi.mRNA.OKI2018_I69.XSR.g13749.t1.cds [Oikopleura dioica]